MVRIDKPYVFEGANGTVSILDLFEGRPQLVMHHCTWLFDVGVAGNEHSRGDTCTSCSAAADCIAEHLSQLYILNTTLVARVPRPVRQDRRLPPTDGMDVPLVLLGRQRLQLRLPRHHRRAGRTSAGLPDRGRARRSGKPWDG